VRPSIPIALSGTTYRVVQAGQAIIMSRVLSMMQRRPASLANALPDRIALFSTWIDGYRP
jgi:hypothetical protein